MYQPIKTGLLAFGMSGRIFHAPFLNVHEGFELTAIVERTHKNASRFYPQIKSYSSVEEMLNDDVIELIVVNTPNFTHFEFARQGIQAGKHVLIEKPFAITSSQAEQLFTEGEKNNVCVLPYHNRRYDSDFISVKQIVESGILGKITEAHFRFDRYATAIGPKKGKETPLPGSGFSYDLGSHLLDGLISLFGIPSAWTKSLGHFRENTQVDDYAHFHLSYPDEMQAFATASVLVPDPQPAFILHGTKGSFIKKTGGCTGRTTG
ncbi:MAG: Gfo/Idh/MocA family oxidoreductase [Candidatus Azobacteroides sp.]|nr:Gfo/Idh/MocA family oxidoreductase [Candidatus Azobacteroides sp.]